MRLKRTKQCAKCPWRKDVDPHQIPNGYDVEKHRGLESTIAKHGDISTLSRSMHVMACHETHDAHCIGWLINQLGPGNNIGLRLAMMRCKNISEVETIGDQHETFSDTLPTNKKAQKRLTSEPLKMKPNPNRDERKLTL